MPTELCEGASGLWSATAAGEAVAAQPLTVTEVEDDFGRAVATIAPRPWAEDDALCQGVN